MKPDEPVLRVSPAQWNAWLARHHASADAAVVMLTKKGAPPPILTYAEALDVALCWGWIDGHKRPHDEHVWLQRFSPRRARSAWSKINRGKAEALIAAGKMQPAGLAEVERARADGRWDAAYDSSRTAQVPDDLAAALARAPAAGALFAELDAANRYAILYRVQAAKRAETRAAKIEALVAMLARGETLHPRKQAKASKAVKAPRRRKPAR
ncbi:MAG TPA: YdeI/OmpD-associated family protein [Kofleriaceae bacterium]|nr:YdeI/OmpD-associated family protein [Kofleriaceae bacterium]